MAIDQSIINFAVYEDSIEYAGMAKATLPDVTFLTQSISGAGIGGNIDAVRYWATYLDGKKVRELDPLNFICYINGTDYLAAVRKALGK